jgi:hypothetical protein
MTKEKNIVATLSQLWGKFVHQTVKEKFEPWYLATLLDPHFKNISYFKDSNIQFILKNLFNDQLLKEPKKNKLKKYHH